MYNGKEGLEELLEAATSWVLLAEMAGGAATKLGDKFKEC